MEVITRHFGDDADSRVAQSGRTGAQVGAGRLDIAPDPAEQIQLPQAVEAALRIVEFRSLRSTPGSCC